MSIDEKAFREQQERLMAENIRLREDVQRLQYQVEKEHEACCEMRELLRQANDLYTGYGLICGPIKDFPKYEGTIHQGEWIGKVRAILRTSEKPLCMICKAEPQEHSQRCVTCYSRLVAGMEKRSEPVQQKCQCGQAICMECQGY